MKLNHRLPLGQTVVFETLNKYKVGKIIDVKPRTKRIEYTVYGEDGKVYDEMPNRVDGSYRIDVKLTKMFCKKYDIEVDELAAEYARRIRSEVVVKSEEVPFTDFESKLGIGKQINNEDSESEES